MSFGHVIIEKQGNKCKCGNNGCFETYCGIVPLKAKVASRMNLDKVRGIELYDMIKAGKMEIQLILDEFIENLNIGLSNYINIFEPEAIAIGRKLCIF